MIQLSKNKIQELNQEFQRLKSSLRMEQSEGTNKGGPMDSFKEAAAFSVSIQAKEVKVKELEQILADVCELPEYIDGETIVIGKWFQLKATTGVVRYRLVHSIESSPAEHLLSLDSPLGKAVCGKKAGDNFEFNNIKFTIVKVE